MHFRESFIQQASQDLNPGCCSLPKASEAPEYIKHHHQTLMVKQNSDLDIKS